MMDYPERYLRNRVSVSEAEQETLKSARVLVVGCGGLGGYVVEALARVGVGHIRGVDADVFCESNLNRQRFCTEKTLGMKKTEAAARTVSEINSAVCFETVCEMMTEENVSELVSGCRVVIDALDSADSRIVLAQAAAKACVPLVHGAISGWFARVYTVMPGDGMLMALCQSGGAGTENKMGNLPFTAAFCASMQAAEAVKLLLGKGRTASGRLVEADLLNMKFDVVDMR